VRGFSPPSGTEEGELGLGLRGALSNT
jgi:hypothetical protein